MTYDVFLNLIVYVSLSNNTNTHTHTYIYQRFYNDTFQFHNESLPFFCYMKAVLGSWKLLIREFQGERWNR